MKIEVTVCDVCADRTLPATTYWVESDDGRRGETARCETHGWELLGISRGNPAPKAAPVGKGGSRRTRRPKVTTMADVEAAKQTPS